MISAGGGNSNNFFPVVYPKKFINTGIFLLNPFGGQAKWIPASPKAFSGTLQAAFYNA